MTVSSGIIALDKMTGGITTGMLYAICGRPAIGKTSLALSISSNVAIRNRIPTAFFSLEVSTRHIISRLHIMEQCDDASKIHAIEWLPNSKYSSDLYPYLIDKSSDMPLLYIDDDPFSSLDIFNEKITKLVTAYGVRFVCFDYLELLVNFSQREAVLKELKIIAEKLDVAIIVTSMLHRFSFAQDDRNPIFCEKQEIIHRIFPENCDTVLVINRPEFYFNKLSDIPLTLRRYTEIHSLRNDSAYQMAMAMYNLRVLN